MTETFGQLCVQGCLGCDWGGLKVAWYVSMMENSLGEYYIVIMLLPRIQLKKNDSYPKEQKSLQKANILQLKLIRQFLEEGRCQGIRQDERVSMPRSERVCSTQLKGKENVIKRRNQAEGVYIFKRPNGTQSKCCPNTRLSARDPELRLSELYDFENGMGNVSQQMKSSFANFKIQ